MATKRERFKAIGTLWQIDVSSNISTDVWLEVMQLIYTRIRAFDEDYSRFRPDSLVAKMAHSAGTYQLPVDGYKMLRFYDDLYKATGGSVTPLIGQTVSDAGYDKSYSFKQKKLSQPPSWESIIYYGENFITLNQAALLDFGAAGKGYLVDIIGNILSGANIGAYTINAGGDILHRSNRGSLLAIGLENPNNTSEVIGIAQISNQSVCASAGSKRKWGDFHHIIDPSLLHSPSEVLATWVIAKDTMIADGLATALFFQEAESIRKQFTFEYAVLNKDMSLQRSAGFHVTTFEAEV